MHPIEPQIDMFCLPCCLLTHGGPSLVRFNLRGKRGNRKGGLVLVVGGYDFPIDSSLPGCQKGQKINISAGFRLQNINTQSGFKLNSYGVLILKRLICRKMTEDKKLKITLARRNPSSEVNPPSSLLPLGSEPRKHIFEQISPTTYFLQWPVHKKEILSDVKTGNIVPSCLEIFEHDRARVWSI